MTPVDEVAPTVSVNTGLTLSEGATAAIPATKLSATDTEADDTGLIFTITAATAHGQVENTDSPGTAISSFTQQNLSDGKIQYVHDDTNTTSDSFVFKVSDGTNELTGQTFSIMVNAGGRRRAHGFGQHRTWRWMKGRQQAIPTTKLSATDADSNDAGLIFTITTATANGQVENTDSPGTAISSFTQQNLIDGKIQYVHDGTDTTSDSFVFKVSDGTNELADQTFSITVNAVDDTAPTISVERRADAE